MRKLILTLLLFAVTHEAQVQVIAGRFTNAPFNTVVLKYPDRYGLNFLHDTVQIAKDGSFRFFSHLNVPLTTATLLMAKRELPLWLVAKEKLVIQVKDSLVSPVFTGALARINNYLQVQYQYYIDRYKFHVNRNPGFKEAAANFSDAYFIVLDSITTDRLTFLKRYFTGKQNSYEQVFIARQESELVYQSLIAKIAYNEPPLERLRYYQVAFNRTGTGNFIYSDRISFNDPGLLTNPFFLRFSRHFFMELVFRFQHETQTKLSKEEFYDKLFSYINQLSRNPACNAVLKASFISDEVKSMMLNERSPATTYSRFIDSLLTYPAITREANNIHDIFLKKAKQQLALNGGAIAPSCILTDTSGGSFALADFKGKWLYIDVWASWCGKCIDGMPAWNKLVARYKDNSNIAFITLSTDETKDKEKWMQLLRRHKPRGQHFLSAGGADSEFAKKFFINSYPHNILIDASGHIIDLDAQRPEVIDLNKYIK